MKPATPKPVAKLNRPWHEANKMPGNPTLDQRIDWHTRHALNCACRPIPATIAEEIERRQPR